MKTTLALLSLAGLLALGVGCSGEVLSVPGADSGGLGADDAATGLDAGEDDYLPEPEPDSGETSEPGEDAGPGEPRDASEAPDDPDAGSAAAADTGPDYVEPDNCVFSEASKFPSTPTLLFRWRAGAPAAAQTPGTLTATLQSLARPAGLAPFQYAHFDPTQYYVGSAAMANPSSGVTIQAWFRMAEVTPGTQTLFSNTESTRGFSLDIKDGRLLFLFSVNASGTAKRYTVPDPADPANASLPNLEIAPGRWTHASVTLHKYSNRYFVRFMVDEKWAYSATLYDTDPLYNSTSMPTVGAESAAAGPTAEGFHGDLHAVVVHNYAVDRNYSTAPALRDGSAYFGLTAYHDYLGTESAGSASATPPYSNQTYSPNKRIWLADRNALWPAMIGRARTRLTLPLLNDGYRPQGLSLSADGRTLWLTYTYANAAGANPDGLADLLVAADLPTKTVRDLYRLTRSGANFTAGLGGLAEAQGHLYLLASGSLWRLDPSQATLEETADANLPGAPRVHALALDAAASYAVKSAGPGLSYEASSNSLWLAGYVTGASTPTPLDRYELTSDGSALARPSATASDEHLETPSGIRFVQGVLHHDGCFVLASFDRDAAPSALSKTPSAVWTWCPGGALAKSAVLAPAAGALALGPGPTAWLLFESGAQALQKRSGSEPLHDTLVPYALGFAADALMRDHVGAVSASTALTAYRGDLHAHSSNSNDAAAKDPPPGSPAKCYARGKTRGLDFLYLTDHVTWGWATDAEWSACQSAATAATTPSYLALCGLETSMRINDSSGNQIKSNHSNVFFYTGDWDAFSSFTGQASFFSKLATKEDALAQFNHPASDRFLWDVPTPTADRDAQMELLEFNGAPDSASRLGKYVEFLDKGWHVAPTWNSDSHTGAETARSAFWMSELTSAGLRSAIVGHRSFVHNSHSDRAGELKVFAGGSWLGAILRGYVTVPVEVVATHPDGLAKLQLFGPGGAVLRTLDCADQTSCRMAELLSPPPKWFYAKATQTNGNYMISAPTWFE